MDPQRELGRRLKAARMAAGLTQAQVTARLGYGDNTLSQYERGELGISDARLVQLAGVYGVAAVDLAGRALTSTRDAAFYDGILHALATFNRASGELLNEVQLWRLQSQGVVDAGSEKQQRRARALRTAAESQFATTDELDEDDRVFDALADKAAALKTTEAPPRSRRRKAGG